MAPELPVRRQVRGGLMFHEVGFGAFCEHDGAVRSTAVLAVLEGPGAGDLLVLSRVRENATLGRRARDGNALVEERRVHLAVGCALGLAPFRASWRASSSESLPLEDQAPPAWLELTRAPRFSPSGLSAAEARCLRCRRSDRNARCPRPRRRGMRSGRAGSRPGGLRREAAGRSLGTSWMDSPLQSCLAVPGAGSWHWELPACTWLAFAWACTSLKPSL